MAETNDTALEKTFSDLAYSHLRDKSQGLLDYLVGFEMLKSEEDGKRAVGIFGFEIDEDFYYAPVFFLNGEIRGLESLYSTKNDHFVPLSESWVDTLINRRSVQLGEADTRDRSQRGARVPNYSRLKVIPGGVGAINLKLAAVKENTGPDLIGHLKAAGLVEVFKTALDNNARLRDSFETFYNYLELVPEEPVVKTAAEEKPVVIINSITDEGVDKLTDEQRKAVVEGGTVVLDDRPELEKAKVYRTEAKATLENPTSGGLYDVLWSDGSVVKCLIANMNAGDNKVVVVRVDDSRHCSIDSRCVYVRRKYDDSELLDYLKDKTPAADVRPGNVGVFVSRTGNATPALCIKQNNTGLDNIKVLKANDTYWMTAGCGDCYPQVSSGYGRGHNHGNATQNMFSTNNREVCPACRIDEVLIRETGQDSPIFVGRRMLVNSKNFWFIPLNKFKLEICDAQGMDYCETESYSDDRADKMIKMDEFGDSRTLVQQLNKIAEDVKVWKTDHTITIKTAEETVSLRPVDALRYMMTKQGMGDEDAIGILTDASAQAQTYKLVRGNKIAAELLQLPETQDLGFGNEMTAYHPTQIPFSTQRVKSPENNREFYQYYSPFSGGADMEQQQEPNTLDAVDRAAQTGQKDVFDAAALGALIKAHHPTDLVDRFLPTIISGMDRLGRILFLIYWHYDEFEERYGEEDLAECIDNLKSTFENLGDLVMFFKQRSMAGDPDFYGVGVTPAMKDIS